MLMIIQIVNNMHLNKEQQMNIMNIMRRHQGQNLEVCSYVFYLVEQLWQDPRAKTTTMEGDLLRTVMRMITWRMKVRSMNMCKLLSLCILRNSATLHEIIFIIIHNILRIWWLQAVRWWYGKLLQAEILRWLTLQWAEWCYVTWTSWTNTVTGELAH